MQALREKAAKISGPNSSEEDITQIEYGNGINIVDKATERRLLRKLDLRIVPMVMWM